MFQWYNWDKTEQLPYPPMISSPFDPSELYTFEALHDRAVPLTPDQIHQARLDSETAADAWQGYCDRLAHFGLINWLAENNLPVQESSAQDTVIRGFTVRSQFVSASEDEFVTMAPAGLVRPAHFYVLATVAEEQGQVWVSGFLTQEQMKQRCAENGAKNGAAIPMSAFNPKIESLLLSLRTTEAMPLSSEAAPNLSDRVVNLRTWLSRQWDETVEQLNGWELVSQALTPSALRGDGAIGDLPQILQSLARKGIRLASGTQGMSRILPIGPIPLRLYVMPGDLTENQEWEMLVVLESATEELMPSGLMLRIRDDEQILLEQTFNPQITTDRSLFAEVVSGLEESVFVEIVLPNGKVHSLPKFVFQDI